MPPPFEPEAPDPGLEGVPMEHRRTEPGVGFGVLLGDAINAFQRLNRNLMLWTVFHRWQRGSRFALNWYRHYPGG